MTAGNGTAVRSDQGDGPDRADHGDIVSSRAVSVQVLAPGVGRSFGPGITVKVEFGQSQDFAVFESKLPPAWHGPPPHVHQAYDEAFYVIDGSVTFSFSHSARACPAGSFIFVPHGATHGFSNPAEKPARILVITSPGAIRLVESIYQLTNPGAEPDFAAMASLYARHQSEIVTPAPTRPHTGVRGRRPA